MSQPEIYINQTLLIWSIAVIIEIFVIAYLLFSPWLIFTAFIMYWPIKAAMNWQIAAESENELSEETDEDSLQS
jgi:hypothetical protein